jgi:hypothetical protein
MKILGIKHFALALILFGPPLFQIITGIGIFVGNFTIGLFPSTIIYFLWLFMLVLKFGVTIKDGLTKRIVTLLLTIIVVLPFYWYLVNIMINNKELMVTLQPIGGVIFIWIIFVLIDTWNYLSKCILLSTRTDVYKSNLEFSMYRHIFFYFVGGILTIWWLQPIISKAIENIEMKFGQDQKYS